MRKRSLAVVVALSASSASADDEPPAPQSDLAREIVVVASRRETPATSATSAISTFDADDVERRRPLSVADLVRETPGAYVSPDGPQGQFTRVFLRGAASNQTLVLVDGIPQNDATSGGLFDFGDLGMTGVERVEVLRGSYSVLYGSEAIGGVVDVRTRRGHGPFAGFVRAEVGTMDSHREEVAVSMGDAQFDFALAAGDTGTDGPRDREFFREHDAVGRFGVAFSPKIRFDGSFRVAESAVESPFDFASSGVLPSDEDIGRRKETNSGGGTLTIDPVEWLTIRATGSAFNVYTRFKNGPADAADTRDELDSRNTATDLRGRLEATATPLAQAGAKRKTGVGLDATVGGESLDERSLSTSTSPNFGAPGYGTTRSDVTTRTKSGFVQANLHLPDAGGGDGDPVTRDGVLTAGVRHDHHSVFGSESSPYLGGRVDVVATTLRASYGEGFRAPKPSELFDPFVGDKTLGPETSKSFDAGVSRKFLDGRVAAGVTWFRLRVDDLIAYDAKTFKLANFSRTRTTGFEYEASADVGRGFVVRGSLTSQNPRDLDTGKPLANRPKTFGSAGVEWREGDWRVSLDGFFSGKDRGQGGEFVAPDRDARRHPGRRDEVDLAATWQADKCVRVFAGLRNLLNDKWVATPNSPAAPGIAAFAGVELDF